MTRTHEEIDAAFKSAHETFMACLSHEGMIVKSIGRITNPPQQELLDAQKATREAHDVWEALMNELKEMSANGPR